MDYTKGPLQIVTGSLGLQFAPFQMDITVGLIVHLFLSVKICGRLIRRLGWSGWRFFSFFFENMVHPQQTFQTPVPSPCGPLSGPRNELRVELTMGSLTQTQTVIYI